MDDNVTAFKVTLVVLNLNGDCPDEGSVRSCLENLRHPEFVQVMDVEAKDIGPWSDDHPLNQTATKREAYRQLFP